MVTIYYNGTSIEVQENDSTFRYRGIMGDYYVTLNFSLNKAIDFPVGAYIIYQGRTYTLSSPEHWKRWGEQNIEYTMTLTSAAQDAMKKYKLRNLQDGRLKFSMVATPKEFLDLIIGNLNAEGRESGFRGECLIDAEEQQVEFNHAYLIDAISDIANKYETEFEVTEDKIVRLGKLEYFKDDPLPLSYGRGNGFKPGTGRVNTDDTMPIEVLYVQGGERNIDRSKYGSSELMLPKGQRLVYQGRTYIASADGYSIRSTKGPFYKNEDSIDLSQIYPKRVGEISGVRTVDASKNFYDFEDGSIPDELDYNKYLIEGETMTVIFQTGMLAGREFDISKYDHEKRSFEIVPAELDGYVMPCDNFMPAVGDKYAIFGCTLPDEYICDNSTQTGAEWDLFKEAARYLYEKEDFLFTFTGELQGKWAKQNWSKIGSRIILGSYIRFSDTDFAPGGVDMRIIGIKDFFNAPYSPVIEISNGVVAAGFSSQLREAERAEVRASDGYERSVSFTKRRWRDARETIDMLENALLDNFTNSITPITVQTMQMLVGDESLQFRFVSSKISPVELSHQFTWNNAKKELSTDGGIIQHMTLGIDTMAASHQPAEYKFWDISAFNSGPLAGDLASRKYYLYAKCSKSNETAQFVLSERAIALEGEAGYWHLLVGILNSEYEDERSFVTLYGFTEILPGRITTDKIVSGSGLTFWDLVSNILKLGDRLQYNVNGDGALLLNGPLVQTGAGTPTEVGAWCGEYSRTRTYKLGDEVWYMAADGTVSTYRYINSVPSSGHPITDTNYWTVYAAGVKGDDAESPVYADIDNEMEGVSLNSDGLTKSQVQMQSTVSMWYGTTELSLLSLSVTGLPTGFSATTNPNTGLITITIARGAYVAANVPISITVSARFGGVVYTRYLTFTVAGISDGGNGDDAVIYSLLPSVSSVKKTKSGTYSVSSVTCKKMKRIGQGGLNETTEGTLKYSIDGGAENNYSGAISTSSFASTLTFLLYIGSVLVDRETIPLIIDGNDGTNGKDGKDGQDGDDGKGIRSTEVRYNVSSSGTDVPVAGWSTTIPSANPGFYIWTRTVITYTDGTTSTSYSVSRQGTNGADGRNGTNGADGAPGPSIVFRGEYSSSATYYGNSTRVDVVYYPSTNQYYVAKSTAGTFSGRIPTNTTYWMAFGASFDSIATGLLLAEEAFIDNAIVRMLETSSTNRKRIVIKENVMRLFDDSNKERLLISGDTLAVGEPVASYPTLATGVTKSYNQNGTSGQDTLSFNICSFSVSNDNTAIKIPALSIRSNIQYTYYGGYISNFSYSLSLVRNNSEYISLDQGNISGMGSGITRIVNTSGNTLNVNKGSYVIKFEARYEWMVDSDGASQGYTNGLSMYVENTTTGNVVTASGTEQKIQIGANGISIHLNNCFSAIFAINNGAPNMLMQGIDSLNRAIGIRLSLSGIQINRGSGWVAL